MPEQHPHKKVELLENPKYYLAIVTIFQNEERFLKEWLDFHILVGVEHFYLYNHLSKDNYLNILKPYITKGIVELVDLSYQPKTAENWNGFQWHVYSETSKKLKDQVEWLAFLDSDEFLYPVKDNDLKKTLRNYDDYATVSVNWRIFGSGNVQRIANDTLMIESLVLQDNVPDLHVKSIIKPRYVKEFNNPHFAVLQPGYTQVTENYEQMEGYFVPSPTRMTLAINHYKYRDLEFFNNTKLSRLHMANSQINDLIKDNQKASSIYDNTILKFAPALRSMMFGNSYNLANGYSRDPQITKKIVAFTKAEENGIILNFIDNITRPLSKLASVRGVEGDSEHRTAVYREVHEDLSTKVACKSPTEVEFRQRSTLDSYFSDNNIDIIRIHGCSNLKRAETIIQSSENLRIFIKLDNPKDSACLLDLETKGFILIDILKFNEECSYLSYQSNYRIAAEDILNSNLTEVLITREETFEKYRKLYSDTQECKTLANKMLFNSATQGNDKIISTCLANGADVNYYDSHFRGTPLYYATYYNHSSTVKLLLDKGADVESKCYNAIPALYTASYLGHYNIVKILLDHNAKKDFKINGKSPLEVAQENGHFKVVELLGDGYTDSNQDSL